METYIFGGFGVLIILGVFATKRIISAIDSYSKKYGQKLGEIDAITLKLDEVSKHTAELTKAKGEIDHVYWRRREEEQTSALKLEEAFITLIKVEQELRQWFANAVNGEEPELISESPDNPNIPHFHKLELLINLYFSPLVSRLESLKILRMKYGMLFHKVKEKDLTPEDREKHWQEFKDSHFECASEATELKKELIELSSSVFSMEPKA